VQRRTEAAGASHGHGSGANTSSTPSRHRREGGRDRGSRRKICQFCHDHIREIDYKDANRFLRKYVSDRGKIEPRRKTGTCQTSAWFEQCYQASSLYGTASVYSRTHTWDVVISGNEGQKCGLTFPRKEFVS